MKKKKRLVKVYSIARCLGIAFAFATINPVQAGLIIQDTDTGAYQILDYSPIGQVFTAEDASIQSIGFFIKDFNPTFAPTDHNLHVNLYSGGSGSSGALIGQANVNNIPDDQDGYIDFDFSMVSLTVGQKYSAMLVDDTVRWGVAAQRDIDNYAGGYSITNVGHAGNEDLRFRVIPAAIPEPETHAMLLAGLGLLGFMLRRRKESMA